jgi:hypothetical protein
MSAVMQPAKHYSAGFFNEAEAHWGRTVAKAPDKLKQFRDCMVEGTNCVRIAGYDSARFRRIFTRIAHDHDLVIKLGGPDALQAKLTALLESHVEKNVAARKENTDTAVILEAKHLDGPQQEAKKLRINGKFGGGKTSMLVALWTIKPRATDWLWRNRIPRGAQTINTGLPGTGKSQQLIDIVAHATTGADWPDGEPCPCGDVILLTAEDALANTVVPRLMAARANIKRVSSLSLIHVDAKTKRAFLLTEDLDELERHLIAKPETLLVGIDPVTAFLGTGKINSHHAVDVRGVLGPLAALAERHNVAIYTVTHPPKASTSAINAFVGSQAFIAAARVGYLTVEETDDEGNRTGRCLVSMVKTNLGPKMPTLAYRLAQITVGQDERDGRTILGSYVVWDGQVDVTADQALAAATGKSKAAEPTQKDEVIVFLETMFARQSRVEVADLEREARAAGVLGADKEITYSKPFRAAKKILGIESKHDGLNQKWFWEQSKVPSEGQAALQNERAPWGVRAPCPPDERVKIQPSGEEYLGPPGDDPADFLGDIPDFLRRV